MNIFVCYRREETRYAARLLAQDIKRGLADSELFIDVDRRAIRIGENWRRRIESAIDASDVVIVLIGQQWLGIAEPGGVRKIDNPDDPVRLELEQALASDRLVVPVLFDDARMPGTSELPESLADLVFRQNVELRHRRWDDDVNEFIESLDHLRPDLEKQRRAREEAARAAELEAQRLAREAAAQARQAEERTEQERDAREKAARVAREEQERERLTRGPKKHVGLARDEADLTAGGKQKRDGLSTRRDAPVEGVSRPQETTRRSSQPPARAVHVTATPRPNGFGLTVRVDGARNGDVAGYVWIWGSDAGNRPAWNWDAKSKKVPASARGRVALLESLGLQRVVSRSFRTMPTMVEDAPRPEANPLAVPRRRKSFDAAIGNTAALVVVKFKDDSHAVSDLAKFKVPRVETTSPVPGAPKLGMPAAGLRFPGMAGAPQRGEIEREYLLRTWKASLNAYQVERFQTALGRFGSWESCLWAAEKAPFYPSDLEPVHRSVLRFFREAPVFFWFFLLLRPAGFVAVLPKGQPGAEAAGKLDAVYRLAASEISSVAIRPVGDGLAQESAEFYCARATGPPFLIYAVERRPVVVAALGKLGIKVVVVPPR